MDYYISIDDSDRIMIIEDIEIITDIENGDHLKISGRSLESILDRRIFWGKCCYYSGKLEEKIKDFLTQTIINPSDSDRQIPNFIYLDSTDTDIKDLLDSHDRQYTGDNLYEVITSLCKLYDLGYKIIFDFSIYKFVFSLYKGKNRSYDVEFSSAFDNIKNTDYINSTKTLRNVTLVLGEDQGSKRRSKVVGSGSGLSRRELYTDARDIQSEEENGTIIPDDKYNSMLEQRGNEKLLENRESISFEGSIDYDRIFVYGRDWYLGDIVKIANDYGISANVWVTEIVRSIDETGYEVYPTFEVI